MKKEASKKSKLWLWLVIGAVVLVAAGVAAFLLLPGLGSKDAGANDGRAELYWNIDRVTYTENSESGLSTREPGEDGVYHVRFAIDGEVVELPVADKRLINYIDTLDAMGLELDQDGAVVDVIDPKELAKEVTKNAYVKSATDKMITANSSVAMNGMTIKVELSELTEIYDVTPGAEHPGKIITTSELAAMDTLTVYATEEGQVTHVYVTSHSRQSKVYWRADQNYNSTEKATARIPDENGAYTIPFFCDGEVVELKTKDKAIATKIDSVSRWKCHFGFAFDEEGYITEQFVSALGIQAVIVADCWDIVDIQGDQYTIQRLTTNDGSVWNGTIPADCVIYEAGIKAKQEGEGGRKIDSLQLGDRVTVWTDTEGKVILVYVAERIVDSPAYWIPTRKYKTADKSTTRTVNANGYYEIELLKEGTYEKQIYYVKDKATMDYIDSQTSKVVGLKVQPGNIIEFAYSSEALTGYTVATRGGVVTAVTGGVFTKMTYGKRGTESNMVLASGARIYNVSAYGQYGETTTILPGDHVYGMRQPTGEIILAYITKRTTGGSHLYWHLDRMYDSTKKVSTRQPDENGWYYLLFAYQGKQVTLRTRDKALVEKLDAQSIGAAGLEVSGDVITNVYDATYPYGGSKVASGYRYRYKTDEGLYHCVYNTDPNKTAEFKMAEDCVIYNVSPVFSSHQGERIYSIPYNAMLTVFCDIYGEAKVVYVRQQDVDNMYWKTETLYDSSNKVTKRIPDADGYYWYDLAVNGEVKTFKTKDQKIANSMDSYYGAFGLSVKDDEIKGFVSTSYVKGVKGNGVNGYCVTAINGNKVTVTYNKPGSSFGKTQTFSLTSNVKIYDVTPDSPNFGAVTELKVGDTIRTYVARDSEAHCYVYVMARSTRAGGETGWCEVCQKEVTWNPVMNSTAISAADGHWYVTQDMTVYVQSSFVSTSKDYTVCLDLNGKTITRSENGRNFRVAEGETLNIMDSVGGGKIVSGGGVGYTGGMFLMSTGGTVNVYGGTLEFVQGEYKNGNGGIANMSGKGTTFNLYDGVVTGGTVYAKNGDPGYGGNFNLTSGATLNMYGGEISNGTVYGMLYASEKNGTTTYKAVYAYGGNISLSESSHVNIMGGVVKDGHAVRETFEYVENGETKSLTNMSYGGNIHKISTNKLDGRLFIENATVSGGVAHRGGNINVTNGTAGRIELKNATIIDGDSSQFGGNIMSAGGNWIVTDSKIMNGTTVSNGGNICSQGGEYVVTGSTISGGVAGTNGGNVYLYKNKTDPNTFTVGKGTVVENGVTNTSHGGNFYVKNKNYVELDGKVIAVADDTEKAGIPLLPTLILDGGEIKGGTCASGTYGGNIYCAGNMDLNSGLVSGGKAGTSDYDIYIPGEREGVVNVGSVQVDGRFRINGPKELYLFGAPKLADLTFAKDIKAVVGELTEGADIKVTTTSGSPVFTTSFEDAQAYVDAGYFTGKKVGTVVTVTAESELSLEAGALPTKEIYCNHCNQMVEFTAWTAESGEYMKENAHYYLMEDHTISANYRIGTSSSNTAADAVDVVVDLNGFNITSTGPAFYVYPYSTLSMQDSVGTGVVTGAGVIRKEKPGEGGVFYSEKGNLNFYSGTYTLADTDKVSNGGVIRNGGTTKIFGGIFNGNTINGMGSAIYTTSKLVVTGGTINGETYVKGSCEISGAPVIEELEIQTGVTITVGEMLSGADITVVAEGVFSKANTNAQAYVDAGYFVSGTTEAITVNALNEMAIGEVFVEGQMDYPCPHCNGAVVTWIPYDANSAEGTLVGNNTHYYIPDGGYAQTYGQVSIQGKVVLDLHGQTLTGKDDKRLWRIEGEFNILDTVGGGQAVADGLPGGGGALAMTRANPTTGEKAVINLYSGTLTMTEDCGIGSNGGILSLAGGTVMNMYGGEIKGGKATNVHAQNVYIGEGALNMQGGFIDGGVALSKDGALTLSGTAKIAATNGGLWIEEGALIQLSAMEDAAEIYVSADSTIYITDVLSNADEYLDNIKPADSAWQLVNQGGKLLLTNGEIPFDPNTVYQQAADMDFTTTDPDGKVTAECPVCREEVEWNVLPANPNTTSITSVESGHYYLSDSIDYTQNKGLYNFTKKQVCINLNGQNMVSTARAFYTENASSVLNMMGEGTVSGVGYMGTGSNAGKGFGTFDLTTNANFYGGTYISTGAGPAIGNRKTSAGEALVSIYAGTTVINENPEGCAMHVMGNGSVAINGGTVTGNVIDNASKGITVSGAPVINALDLTNGETIVVGQLTEGAAITVLANGVFTSEVADPAAAIGYFSTEEGKRIAIDGTNLSVVDDTPLVCRHCGKTESELAEAGTPWTPWTAAYGSGTKGTIASGHYYLTESVTDMNGYYYIGSSADDDTNGLSVDVVLDMRGFSLQSKTRVFYGYTNNHLTIMDSVGGSIIQGGLATSAGGTVFFGDGGGNASLSLYGITIRDGATATREKNGGVLFLSGNTGLVLEDCNLTGGNALNGGAIAISSGVVVIKDSCVTGGTVTEKGGAIYMSGAGKLVLENAQVTGGTAATGNCIYIPSKGSVELTDSEAEEILLNATDATGIFSGASVVGKLDLTSGALVDLNGLTTGAAITVVADGVFTTDLTDAETIKGYITSGVSDKGVVVEGTALAIKEETTEPEPEEELAGNLVYEKAVAMDFSAGGTVTALCPACGVNHDWAPLPAPTSSSTDPTPAGAYYVAEDMEVTKFWYFKSGNICINLNGKNITNNNDRVFYVEGATTVANFMGDGVVTGTGKYNAANTNYVGSALDVCTAVNLYGGSWKSTNESPILTNRGSKAYSVVSIYRGTQIVREEEDAKGLNVYIADSGTVNLYDGTISGGTAIEHAALTVGKCGGNVLLKANLKDLAYTATFNMEGGEVEYGEAEAKGENIAAIGNDGKNPAAVININGGKVLGGSVCALGANASVNVSGDPFVDYLDMIDTNLLNVGELEDGAYIYVDVDKDVPFTTPIAANAETYATYFDASGEYQSVVAKDNVLVLTDVCYHCGKPMSDITWTDMANIDTSYKFIASGHYRLTEDITCAKGNAFTFDEATATTGLDVVLDTRGFNINSKGGRCFYVNKYQTLTVFDSVGGSVATSESTNAALGGSGVFATTGSQVTIYDLTINGSANAFGKGNALSLYADTSVVSLYGVTLNGNPNNETNITGGTIYNNGTLYMEQCTVNDSNLPNGLGSCIYSDGDFHAIHSSMNGDVYVNSGAFKVEGAIEISELQIASGILVEFNNLISADITVDATGAFTAARGAYQTYMDEGYIKAVAGKTLKVEDNVLIME